MMNEVIIDTNVMVGLYDKNDQWPKQAKKLIQGLNKASRQLVLLDCVANETFTVLARRLKERNRPRAIVPTLRKIKAVFAQERIANFIQFN